MAAGDMLITADGRHAPVRWVYAKHWSAAQMQASPNLAPICIAQDALGIGLPKRDLYVSQQHRILVDGPIAKRMFGSREVLVPAKALLDLPGVRLHRPNRALSYHHVMLDAHDIVISEGIRSESLYFGPQALTSIPEPALNEAMALLGLSKSQIEKHAVVPARQLTPMKQARHLIARHLRNSKPITLAWA
ncbi:MAG: Hint domain-containing protein [Planktotalea sp.]|uniref:Hint domain-containing protein n=1 Tax=Planktotalea sp. TaxID=2029877 RepID=UPI003C770F9C